MGLASVGVVLVLSTLQSGAAFNITKPGKAEPKEKLKLTPPKAPKVKNLARVYARQAALLKAHIPDDEVKKAPAAPKINLKSRPKPTPKPTRSELLARKKLNMSLSEKPDTKSPFMDPLTYRGPFPFMPVEGRDLFEIEEVCQHLVEPKAKAFRSSDSCTGDAAQEPHLQAMGKNLQRQCMRDLVPRIYTKMCQLCSIEVLDGVIAVVDDRGGAPCQGRFQSLQKIANAVFWDDPRVVGILMEATKVLQELQGKYPAWGLEASNEAFRKLAWSARPYADLNSNLVVGKDELLAFLQAVYVISDVGSHVIVHGSSDPLKMVRFASADLATWLKFFEKDYVTPIEKYRSIG